MANGHTQEELVLHQIWVATEKGVESTVVVEPSCSLSGTQVHMLEKADEIELAVVVSIPGSRRSFSVGSPFETLVFGSEFTYEDFRFLLPPGEIEMLPNNIKSIRWTVNYPGL